MQLDRKCEIGVYDGQSENVSLFWGGGVGEFFKSAFYCPKTSINKGKKKIKKPVSIIMFHPNTSP